MTAIEKKISLSMYLKKVFLIKSYIWFGARLLLCDESPMAEAAILFHAPNPESDEPNAGRRDCKEDPVLICCCPWNN